VWDQNAEGQNGSFIGWALTLWGSTIDASQARTYVLLDQEGPFPPPADQNDSLPPSASTTRMHPKPTEHLPGDHGEAEGEAHKPAFSSAQAQPTESWPGEGESMTPTPDEGWFPGMYNLVSNSKWVFGAIGAVAICGFAGGVFFLWRRRATRRAQYRSIAGDEMPMPSLDRDGRPTGTKELYDAFGEVSEEEDDDSADEETRLRRPVSERPDVGFHSAFLDDDEQSPQPVYTDEPLDSRGRRQEISRTDREKSPSNSDESWQHADTP
jgi:kexin